MEKVVAGGLILLVMYTSSYPARASALLTIDNDGCRLGWRSSFYEGLFWAKSGYLAQIFFCGVVLTREPLNKYH